MTGTGTQADPFRPTNWDEFVTAVETQDSYVECPENAVWDMNEVAPQGIERTITIKASVINGNGLTIRNLRHNATVLKNYEHTPNKTISNIKFENIYGKGNFFSKSSADIIIFDKCVFNGINIGKNIYIFEGSGANTFFKQCGFNFEGNDCGLFYGYYDKTLRIIDSHIVFNGLSLSYLENSGSVGAYFDNCLVEGKFSNIIGLFASFCIFDCECNLWIMEEKTNCIINSDKSANYGSGFKAVSTEQLHDAPYLRSLGFPIGVK